MILPPSTVSYAEAARVLRDGGVVAHPTESVYGLAVDPFSETALRRLFTVKGRPETNPVLVIISSPVQLAGLVDSLTPEAEALMARFWPGPLSLVLPRAKGIPDALTAGSELVCVRCSSHPMARALCDAFGGPITSTSANLSGQPPANTIAGAMLPGVDVGIHGGTLPPAAPSTIYNPATGQVLRLGPISVEDLDAALR